MPTNRDRRRALRRMRGEQRRLDRIELPHRHQSHMRREALASAAWMAACFLAGLVGWVGACVLHAPTG